MRGHLGVSSRNSETVKTSMEIEAIKIVNHDPNAYKNVDGGYRTQASKDSPSKMAYTDAIEEEAEDIFDLYA